MEKVEDANEPLVEETTEVEADMQNEMDMLPSSSRVKKVLQWNAKTHVFEMEQRHQDELR